MYGSGHFIVQKLSAVACFKPPPAWPQNRVLRHIAGAWLQKSGRGCACRVVTHHTPNRFFNDLSAKVLAVHHTIGSIQGGSCCGPVQPTRVQQVPWDALSSLRLLAACRCSTTSSKQYPPRISCWRPPQSKWWQAGDWYRTNPAPNPCRAQRIKGRWWNTHGS